MVNLAKIRKKAKEGKEKKVAASSPLPGPSPGASRDQKNDLPLPLAGEGAAERRVRASPTGDKLEKFKQEAGRRREIQRAAPDRAPAGELLEALHFVISGEYYAVGIEKIVEIVTPRAITHIPNADPFIVGIISLRGTVVTLLDLRRRLSHPPAAGPSEERRIVVVDHDGETVGFEVDRVLRVVSVPRAEIEPHPVAHAAEEDESVQGVFRVSSSLTILLDLDKLLKTAAMLPAS